MGCVLHLSVKLSFHRLSSGSSCAFLIFPLWKVKANKDSVPSNIISRRSLSSWPKLKLEWHSAASNIINISYCYILIYFSLSCGLAVNLYKWGLLSYIMVIIPPLLKTTSVHFDFSVSEHQNLFHHNSPSLWLANEDKKRTDRLGIFTEISSKKHFVRRMSPLFMAGCGDKKKMDRLGILKGNYLKNILSTESFLSNMVIGYKIN